MCRGWSNGERQLAHWDWVKWLPHSQHPKAKDGAGSARLLFDDLGELEDALADQLDDRPRWNREANPVYDQPHLVVIPGLRTGQQRGPAGRHLPGDRPR